jgi:hypothetical protein
VAERRQASFYIFCSSALCVGVPLAPFSKLLVPFNDLGDPAGIPIDHCRVAFLLPSAGQAFIGPIASAFSAHPLKEEAPVVSCANPTEASRQQKTEWSGETTPK